VRVGSTILSLMLVAGLSLAAQTVALNAPSNTGAFSPTLRQSEVFDGLRSSLSIDLHGDTRLGDYLPSSTWESIPKPPDSVDRLAHAIVYDPSNDKIYMIGGNPAGNTGTYLTLCQEFDPHADTWATKAPMPTARGWINACYCRDKIYVIGGHDNSSAAIATNECFDPVANSWSTNAARPRIGLADQEVVWRDSLIYVMGGSDGTSGFAYVDIYDVATDSWKTGTALPLVSSMGSAAIVGDTIFMVQGLSVYPNCWPNLYRGVINDSDPTKITWTAGPTPTEVVFNGATAAMNGNVYWLGGFVSATSVTNHLWKYSTSTESITAVTPNYPAALARCNFMVARPSTEELYVMAGDEYGDWYTPNELYYRISFAPPVSHDVKLSGMIAPQASMNHGSVKPIGVVKNLGLNPESSIPVTCWIDSAGTRVYSAVDTLAGPVASGASANDTFPTSWTSGPSGAHYTVTMFTALSNDSNQANDTMWRSVTITGPGVQESTKPTFILYGASPSLIRGQSRISYSVSGPGYVSLGVYDATGRLVRMLVNSEVAPGERSAVWNRADNSGRTVAKGTYFYRLTVGGRSVSSKAVVIN